MKLTARDLLGFGVIDEIVPEPIGGAQRDPQALFSAVDEALVRALLELRGMTGDELLSQRYDRFRKIGQ
jgi:acetyl-CoA carboxylase carboxyl transferase subunit alpha